jgi:hypothetical protein
MPTPRLHAQLLLVGLLVIAAAAPAGAQSPRASAVMSVGATVVRCCTIETAGAVTQGAKESGTDAVKIRCGSSVATYPPQAGLTPASSTAKDAPPLVSATPDGRALTIQF